MQMKELKDPKKKSTVELLAAARTVKGPPPMPPRKAGRGRRAGYGGEFAGVNYKPLMPVIDELWTRDWRPLQITVWLCEQGHGVDDRSVRSRESGGKRWTEVPGRFRYLYQAVALRCRGLEMRRAREKDLETPLAGE